MEDYNQSDFDRFYIPRKDGRRGLIAVEGCIELAGRGLEVYIHGSEERLIQVVRRDELDDLEVASVLKKAKKEKRLQDWEEKALHGQYLRQTSQKVWQLQNQSIRTNLIKAKTDKSQKDTLWRLCKKANESIDNFVNCCGKLAQTEYKKQDDNLGKIVHWKLARKCDFEAGGK